MTWIFFLKTKDQVFKRIQEFNALAENHTGKRITVLMLNNGGEYTSKEMEFCRSADIKIKCIVSYNPQQNEVVERKNNGIVGATRAMLHNQRLPFFLWVEACNIAVFLQNRSVENLASKVFWLVP